MANGRCRMHGGGSTGPRTDRGRLASQTARWRHGRHAGQRLPENRDIRDIVRRVQHVSATVPAHRAVAHTKRNKEMSTTGNAPLSLPDGTTVRAWFSFRSPYSYLGMHKALKAGLPLHLVATWPEGEVASTSTPRRMNYLIEDCARLFDDEGIPFAPPVDVEKWIRPHGAFHVAVQQGKGEAFMMRAYQARWSESKDLGNPTTIAELAEEVGLDPQSAADAMDDPAVHEEMLAIRKKFAQDEPVGVPFFVYEGQRFWGQDRVDALLRHIAKFHGRE